MCDTMSNDVTINYKCFSLWNRYYNKTKAGIDSVMIENFNCQAGLTPYTDPIAGVSYNPITRENISQARVWMRKSNIVRGNAYRYPTAITAAQAWTNSRGTDKVDSEWIPIPKTSFNYDNYADIPFTSIKNHGTGSLTTIVPKNGLQINLSTKIISVPYGVRRDSIFRNFTFGPNLAWEYKLGGTLGDYTVMTGDSIFFYTLGLSDARTGFRIEVQPKTVSYNGVTPLLYKLNPTATNYTKLFEISENAKPIDSISYVPYGCRIDTFIKNLVIDPSTTYKFTFNGGVERPDLVDGDIFTIKAADNSEKQYKISVIPYTKNTDATLQTIIFPGFENWTSTITYLPTDTMYGFNKSSYYSIIKIDKSMEICPEILAIPTSNRSKVNIKRAMNLNGNETDRSIIIDVVAEDGIAKNTYKFVFMKEMPRTNLPYTPFFSDFVRNSGTSTWADGPNQIYNPTDEMLDFTDYMIVMFNGSNITTYMNTTLVNDTNKWNLRPGYMVVKDPTTKLPRFKEDLNQTSIMIKPKSCWSFSRSRVFPNEGPMVKKSRDKNDPLIAALDFTIWTASDVNAGWVPNVYKTGVGLMYGWALNGAGYLSTKTCALYKIKSDSVKDGIKPMNDLVNDYELIDIVGGGLSNFAKVWAIYDFNADGSSYVHKAKALDDINGIYRKPTIYRGNTIDGASFGFGNDTATAIAGEWVDYSYKGDDANRNKDLRWYNTYQSRYKNHIMNLTADIAYLTSPLYKISPEIIGEQSIKGVLPNTTFTQFLQNVVIADKAMKVKLKAANGTLKSASDVIENGDYVVSISAPGTDSVTYKVTTGSFDSNISLTSASYTVTVAGDKKTGTITGIPFGTTAKEVMAKLVKPGSATWMFTDGGDAILSTVTLPTDSNKFKIGARNELLATEKTYIEVRAENGDRCVYSLGFKAESTPYLLSDIYEVKENEKYINYVNNIVTPVFLSRLKAAPGFGLN